MLLPRKRLLRRKARFSCESESNGSFGQIHGVFEAVLRILRSKWRCLSVQMRVGAVTEAGQRVKKACVSLREFLLMKC
jgi:hypothetical protein